MVVDCRCGSGGNFSDRCCNFSDRCCNFSYCRRYFSRRGGVFCIDGFNAGEQRINICIYSVDSSKYCNYQSKRSCDERHQRSNECD